jgi:heme/copper-type cytochrome/quinol oxidase subunit 2
MMPDLASADRERPAEVWRSAVDWWIWLIVVVAVVVLAVLTFALVQRRRRRGGVISGRDVTGRGGRS